MEEQRASNLRRLDLTEEDYRKHPGLNNTRISQLLKGFKHLKRYDEVQHEMTSPMEFGVAAHMFLLDGEEAFHDRYVVINGEVDKRTKEYKRARDDAEEAGKKLISASDVTLFETMRTAIDEDPIGDILYEADHEVVSTWDHVSSRVKCKSKIDILGLDFIADLKFTSKEIDPFNDRQLAYMIQERAYYRQLAFYMEPYPWVEHLYLVFIETNAPHQITWVDLMKDPAWIEAAHMEIDYAVRRYSEYERWISGDESVKPSNGSSERRILCPEWVSARANQFIIND